MGDIGATLGLTKNRSSSSGKENTSITPTFGAQGQALLNRLTGYAPFDVNSAVQGQIAAIQNSTANDLPGILASARSAGYNRPGNWGAGNVAGAAAQRLAQRDVALAEAQGTAAMQQAQNELANNQTLAGILSLLRGETSNRTYSEKSKGSGVSGGLSGAI